VIKMGTEDEKTIKNLERALNKELTHEETGSSKENKLRNILTKVELTKELCLENRAYLTHSSNNFDLYVLKEKLSICNGCHSYKELAEYPYCMITKVKK
jgi:hypothetical protein